ncbi:MAG: hypothetical protein JOY86_05645 [Candidatus Eremiobacteraeota bacterium]|nr:hypothetical protein [Candidatus Eremiobacteraeota bacterium]
MSRMGAIWYAIGAAIMIGGVTWAVAGAFSDFKAMENAFQRFVVPGTSDLHIDQPGRYVIYYEYRSVVDGEVFATPESTDIKCTLADEAGHALELVPTALNGEYAFNGYAGRAVEQFDAAQPGTFVIACDHASGKGERIALAVAPPVVIDFIGEVFKRLAIAFLSLGIGLAILIVTLIVRAGAGRTRPVLPQ